jgi:hypothetical protein
VAEWGWKQNPDGNGFRKERMGWGRAAILWGFSDQRGAKVGCTPGGIRSTEHFLKKYVGHHDMSKCRQEIQEEENWLIQEGRRR